MTHRRRTDDADQTVLELAEAWADSWLASAGTEPPEDLPHERALFRAIRARREPCVPEQDFAVEKYNEAYSRDKESQMEESKLQQELSALLNRHCRENQSNTPDFLLAEFMLTCLAAFERTSRQREEWYGRFLTPGGPVTGESPRP